jgi:hypothetical protein
MSCVALILQFPAVAMAGMPSVRFSDVIRIRLEVISFFLVVMLVSAAIVRSLWNWLRRDFSRLPRLTYAKSFGIVTLWGLLFVVVLTMISGARELMTPGAWERDGRTYKLRAAAKESGTPQPDNAQVRRSSIGSLAAELNAFAKAHDGRFPTSEEFSRLGSSVVDDAGIHGMKYAYVPGLAEDGDAELLAFEPAAYDDPYALFTDGEIRRVPYDEIERLRAGEVR